LKTNEFVSFALSVTLPFKLPNGKPGLKVW
jgi:hypothetical protein